MFKNISEPYLVAKALSPCHELPIKLEYRYPKLNLRRGTLFLATVLDLKHKHTLGGVHQCNYNTVMLAGSGSLIRRLLLSNFYRALCVNREASFDV